VIPVRRALALAALFTATASAALIGADPPAIGATDGFPRGPRTLFIYVKRPAGLPSAVPRARTAYPTFPARDAGTPRAPHLPANAILAIRYEVRMHPAAERERLRFTISSNPSPDGRGALVVFRLPVQDDPYYSTLIPGDNILYEVNTGALLAGPA
jgi:hypothetical protein